MRRSMGAAGRGARALPRVVVGLLRRAHQRQVSRQAGFALLVVMTSVAVLAAVVGEFGYNARVEAEAAANARDTLRAEYLARSGINLSRILIKVQQRVVDPINAQMKSDFQIVDFAPFLLGAFGGGDDERKSMGDLLGLDTSKMQGLGIGKGATFDVVFGTEDGKVNLNCACNFAGTQRSIRAQGQASGPPNSTPPSGANNPLGPAPITKAGQVYNMLVATMFPIRYNRLFDTADAEGQFYAREDVAKAIIDWSDADDQRFDPIAAATGAGSSATEDYRYDALRDPYRARNNCFDTTEEINLVRGVGDEVWGNFGQMFTVYGGCKINIKAIPTENWPITAALVRATALNPMDPVLSDDTIVSALAQKLLSTMALPLPLISSMQDAANLLKNGGNPQLPDSVKALGIDPSILSQQNTGLPSLQVDANRLGDIARMNVPREVYRIESTGSIKRAGDKKIQVRVRAIFDTLHFNSNYTGQDANGAQGTYVYWRME